MYSVIKVFLKISQYMESLFNKLETFRTATFFKKETPEQVFFCEYCEIFKNVYFGEYLPTTAS